MAAKPEEEENLNEEEEEESKGWRIFKIICQIVFHIFFIAFFVWCTIVFLRYDKGSPDCIEPEKPEEDVKPSKNSTKNDTTTEPEGDELVFKPYILCSLNWCVGYGFLLVMFIFFYFFWIYYMLFKPYVGQKIYDKSVEPVVDKWMEVSRRKLISIILLFLALIFVTVVIVVESLESIGKVRGIGGPIFFVFCGFVFSVHRKSIPWRIVVHGILLQFILGIIIIRWETGRNIFACAGDKVATFLGFARAGALFVYGNTIVNDFVFAFTILAVIFFFSVLISCLYYWGIMQFFLGVMGWVLQAMTGTSVCESVNAAGNVFLGMSESPLMIRPYIGLLTKSELHCICVSGYATVAGTVLGAFILFGASPAHLITASVMAAPGALAFSKLFYPETEESLTKSENIVLEKSKDLTLLEAASTGASNGMSIVLRIVSTIIAFVAIMAFFNALVEWVFELAGKDGITFIWLCSKAFMPLCFLMGVPWHDCEKIGEVVAQKSLVSEFVGYQELGVMSRADEIEPRSAAIATFALCGFANPSSLGLLIGSLVVMAPERHADISEVAFRAFFVGSIVSFTSASFAGILLQENEVNRMMDQKSNMLPEFYRMQDELFGRS